MNLWDHQWLHFGLAATTKGYTALAKGWRSWKTHNFEDCTAEEPEAAWPQRSPVDCTGTCAGLDIRPAAAVQHLHTDQSQPDRCGAAGPGHCFAGRPVAAAASRHTVRSGCNNQQADRHVEVQPAAAAEAVVHIDIGRGYNKPWRCFKRARTKGLRDFLMRLLPATVRRRW